MRAAVLLLLACSACSQIFGLDRPNVIAAADGAQGDTVAIDDGHPTDASSRDAAWVTVSFQVGVGGYANAQDTYIDSGVPNATRNTDSLLRWRVGVRWTLIQFDAIFGAAMGRVPQTATIQSAQLELGVGSNNCTGDIREVAIAWVDTDSYNTFGPSPGVDTSDVGAVVAVSPTVTGATSTDVTSSLASWRADPATNHGWIIEGLSGGDCNATSSDNGIVASHPRLVVTYVP